MYCRVTWMCSDTFSEEGMLVACASRIGAIQFRWTEKASDQMYVGAKLTARGTHAST